MNLAELRATLIEWLDKFMVWPTHTKQNWSDYILTDTEWMNYKWPQGIPDDCQRSINDERQMYLQVFTDEHEYRLKIYIHENGTVGMMGMAYARKPRAGENWNRMNDFTEGEFSKKTLDSFFVDIALYEIIAKVKKQESLPDDSPSDYATEVPPVSKTAV